MSGVFIPSNFSFDNWQRFKGEKEETEEEPDLSKDNNEDNQDDSGDDH